MPFQIPPDEVNRVYEEIKALSGFLPPNASRYLEKDVIGYLSPDALNSYMLCVLRTYAHVLGELGLIPEEAAREIEKNVTRGNVPYSNVEARENIIKHDVRALVQECWEVLSEEARSFLYPGFTSYDLINTAQSMALQDAAHELMIPEGVRFSRNLIAQARKHKGTVMMGRTHLQHATATTAGHYFVEVLGGVVPPLYRLAGSADELRGKASGFVGTNAARTMLFGERVDPDEIDERFFALLGLKPDYPTGQTVHQHWYMDYFSQLIAVIGGVVKFAEDLRNYQQTEVREMLEQRLGQQVGSSTGSHKGNPVASEQTAGGRWRQMLGQYLASLHDLQTDFQRDLRDSSNKRGYMWELTNLGYGTLRKAAGVAEKMTVLPDRMAENFGITRGLITAEPLQAYMQVWCGSTGQPFFDAHEHVRLLTNRFMEEDPTISFIDFVQQNPLVAQALQDATDWQRGLILNPELYIGTSVRDVERTTEQFEEILDGLQERGRVHLEMASRRK